MFLNLNFTFPDWQMDLFIPMLSKYDPEKLYCQDLAQKFVPGCFYFISSIHVINKLIIYFFSILLILIKFIYYCFTWTTTIYDKKKHQFILVQFSIKLFHLINKEINNKLDESTPLLWVFHFDYQIDAHERKPLSIYSMPYIKK